MKKFWFARKDFALEDFWLPEHGSGPDADEEKREGNGGGVGGHLGGAELPAQPSKRVKPNSYATDRLLI